MVLKKKIFMTLVKVSKADVIQGDYYSGFCNRGERAGSTLKTMKKSGNL